MATSTQKQWEMRPTSMENPYTMEWEINKLDKQIKRTSMEESTQNYSKIHPKFKKQPKIIGRPHPKLLGAQKKSDRKTSRIDGKPNRQPMQKINQNRRAIDPNIDGKGNPTCWGNPPKQVVGNSIQNRWDVCVCM